MKEIKENLNKSVDVLCSWNGRLNIVNMSVLLKLMYSFNAVPITIPGRIL